jgi:O-antigen/teichoic acid export membrane protein
MRRVAANANKERPRMIQRAIGVTIGAIVSLILLTIVVPNTGATWSDYVTPLVIGAIAAWLWPLIIVFWLGRRAKARREGQIEGEVQRQLDEERRNQR